jgi:putative intracellular protease/amidase
MSRYLVQRIESHALIRVAYQSELKALEGDARVERVTWRRANDDIEETRAIRHVFVMTGASPHTAWLAGCLALDDKGFVLAGQDWRKTTPPVPWPLEREPFMLETSLPGVFVVGDARSGSVKRVASAVGEGSVVVHLVHRALAAQVSAETARLDEASLPATPPRSTTSSPNPSRESTTMSTAKKVLFVITNSETAFWLSEVTHPYWHLTERGVTVDFASPKGGKVVYDPYSDPYFANSTEPDDLVSKGFLGEKQLAAKLDTTLKLKDVDLTRYDAIHVAGGRGATFDLYPNEDVAKALEHFWSRDKVVGAICHGAVALGNIPDRVRGRQLTGYTLEGDQELQRLFGKSFLIPHYPQTVLEETGAIYKRVGANDPYVIADGKLVTGQNQQSASEYALVLLRTMTGASPVSLAS